jgi:L-asparaginase
VADILALHTGGTICMARGPNGLAPSPGILEATLARLVPPEVRMKLITFDPLIDSADIGCEHWNQLIELIIGHDVAGVVVTHGTDTMAFTGAALSFALDGIGIPVVLTGSMKPLGEGLQAEDNLRLAIDAATTGPVGVWLAFDGKLLCGRRLVKHHSQSQTPFARSPMRRHPLGRLCGAVSCPNGFRSSRFLRVCTRARSRPHCRSWTAPFYGSSDRAH